MNETVIRGQAIAYLHAQNWELAYPAWCVLYQHGALSSVEDFHACARVFEVNCEWSLHEKLIADAVRLFPEDISFGHRAEYRKAMMAYANECWKESFDFLTRLKKNKPELWPFSTEYYRWQAYIQLQLLGCPPSQRLEVVRRLAFFKSPGFCGRQLAGLDLIVDSLGLPDELEKPFTQRLAGLVSVLSQTDRDFSVFLKKALPIYLLKEVQGMAELFRGAPQLMKAFPEPYMCFFARLFLVYGFCDLYFELRDNFFTWMSKIPEMDLRAGDNLPEFLFAAALQCESGSRSKLDLLAEMAERREVKQKVVIGKLLALSELYFPRPGQGLYMNLAEMSEFSEFIRGKSIAIVGPVEVGLNSGEEIDKFDLVIRFNPRPAVALDPKCFGQRTDIGYYATINLLYNDHEYLDGMNELQWVVVEENDWSGLKWLERVRVPLRKHLRAWSYDSPFLFGTPNAVQRVLMDILRFDPLRVKIFNFNLYLTSSFAGGYADTQMNVFPIMAIHDPISNFLFTKKCFEHWGVEVDEVAEGILNMTAEKYMAEVVRQYSRFVR
ncbi:hypothetical protein ACYCFK_16145 [Stutzerimonas stutzeri]